MPVEHMEEGGYNGNGGATGRMYQAGTLSGNPVAVAAGLATLKELKKKEPTAVLIPWVRCFVRVYGIKQKSTA